MSKPKFSELFGEYFEKLDTSISNGIVEECNLNIDDRTLCIKISENEYICKEEVNNVKCYLKNALRLNSCEVCFDFDSKSFCQKACEDIIAELKIKNPSLNGYFADADYTLSGDKVVINIKHGGYKRICECEFEKLFKNEVKSRFGCEVEVALDGQLDDVEIELPPPEPVQVAHKPQKSESKGQASPEVKINFDKREDKPQNGMVYLDNPKIFYGRNINTNTKPMIEVTDEDREISCWGEVFGVEVRTINTKRGESNILSFSFSDHTNSLTCSMFVDPKRMGEVAPVANGNFILVNGSYEFDNYKKEFIVKPKVMAQLQKYTETDDYEGEKRVELHCHTNMSAKDAVSSAGDIISQAFKWGHKAVAITDHGVVQAYPAAAEAVKKIRKGGGDFKVIYGVEGYFVDDIHNDISGLNYPCQKSCWT